MKVSIVIPVYNAEKYLEECIESALSQTYNDIEIIAVDDGSKDNSLKILQKYSEKIKIITKKNGGTASALNVGIKAMSGEWFKWLSADDVLYPSAVQELIKESQRIYDKKNTILYSNYDIIDSNGNIIDSFIEPNHNNMDTFDFNVILLDHFIGNGITVLIHKSALDEYGYFDESIGFQEDYELWLRFCLKHNCRFHLIPKKLAKYRVHESQLTQTKIGKSLENADKIRKIVLSILPEYEREKYKLAVKQFKKKKSAYVKSRRIIRDILLRILPKKSSQKILKFYLDRKSQKSDID